MGFIALLLLFYTNNYLFILIYLFINTIIINTILIDSLLFYHHIKVNRYLLKKRNCAVSNIIIVIEYYNSNYVCLFKNVENFSKMYRSQTWSTIIEKKYEVNLPMITVWK